MEQQRLQHLLEQHQAGTATTREQEELADLLKADADRELFNTVLAGMMRKEPADLSVNEGQWTNMLQAIVSIDKTPVASLPEHSTAKVFPLFRWAAAAAVLLVAGIGGYFLINRTQPSVATATEKPVHYKVMSTARGERYEVILPDSSHVWLNAGSSIRFPASFTGKERSVELTGEAWFDVKHADQAPFIIHSGAITTTVMGTAFDIKAYPGQKTLIVSVQRGKVRVQAGDKILATLLKGQQVRVAADTTFDQQDVDASSIAAWKEGNLLYKDETLKDIVADLQRVFKDSVEIKRASLQDVMTTVSFDKNISQQQALEIICRIVDARLSERNGKYVIE